MTPPQLEASNSLSTESIVRWHIGDWEYLVELAAEDVAQHSDKCLIAMFKAAALFQQGLLDAARTWVNQAIGWGADSKMLARIVLSGAHNSLGRAALLAGWEPQAQSHIKEAMRIGCIELDGHLLFPARLMQQKSQINAKARLCSSQPQQVQPSLTPTKEQLQAQQQLMKDKLNQAKQARAEKNYLLAEQLLSEILQFNPGNVIALKENASLKAAQQQWLASVNEYDRLICTQVVTESALRTRSLMKKNAGLLHEAIADLECAKVLGFYNGKIAHQLSMAYRDNQQWEDAENEIRELCIKDPEYFINLSLVTFAADLLRKREKVKEAYGLIKVVIEQAKVSGQEIPLNTHAVFEELQRAINIEKYSIEVSRYYYDDIYARSEKYRVDSAESIYFPVWEKVFELLNSENIQKVLDIGCGPGQFAEFLLRKNQKINYCGIDYSQVAINTARLRCPSAVFFVEDLLQENLLNTFEVDLFIILEVLEHIQMDLDLISRMPSKKKIIFSVPNFDSFNHVRFFNDSDAVLSRYQKFFSQLSISEIQLSGRSKIYLGIGLIK